MKVKKNCCCDDYNCRVVKDKNGFIVVVFSFIFNIFVGVFKGLAGGKNCEIREQSENSINNSKLKQNEKKL